MKVAAWSLPKSEQLCQINVGSPDKPQYLKISAHLDKYHAAEIEQLLWEFKDVFAWSYKDLKGIPPSLAKRRIKLEKDVPTAHQARYMMNPNFANIVKQDSDRLLEAGFIAPVEEASWLSPIVVVPKKNGKLRICVDFRKLNTATKKDPYPLPFTDEVLDAIIGYALYTFLDGFCDYWFSRYDWPQEDKGIHRGGA
jgi:hypothetical protein